MADKLKARDAEILALEAKLRREWAQERPGSISGSVWHGREHLIRDVDKKYGFGPDDPRVYSIASYLAERRTIDEDFREFCRQSHDEAEGWRGSIRHHHRLEDCDARHFPGLFNSTNEGRVDTIPKLWAFVRLQARVHESLFIHSESSRPGNRSGHAATQHRGVQLTYSAMSKLQIPWTPTPPYQDLTYREAMDRLNQIANRLEREEAERNDADATEWVTATQAIAIAMDNGQTLTHQTITKWKKEEGATRPFKGCGKSKLEVRRSFLMQYIERRKRP